LAQYVPFATLVIPKSPPFVSAEHDALLYGERLREYLLRIREERGQVKQKQAAIQYLADHASLPYYVFMLTSF
jgi:hypothetical protein